MKKKVEKKTRDISRVTHLPPIHPFQPFEKKKKTIDEKYIANP